MIRYDIKKPIWNGRAVGIAAHRLVPGTSIEMTISYKDKDGNLLYPGKYRMACSKAKKYKTQQVVGGVVLHIIPIKDFEVAND